MTAQHSPLVAVTRRDDVCTLAINRPERHNTMTAETLVALAQAFDQASADLSLRAVVLTGAGDKTFCAGGQLKSSEEGSPFDHGLADFDNRAVARAQLDLFDALWQSHQPQVSLRIASR